MCPIVPIVFQKKLSVKYRREISIRNHFIIVRTLSFWKGFLFSGILNAETNPFNHKTLACFNFFWNGIWKRVPDQKKFRYGNGHSFINKRSLFLDVFQINRFFWKNVKLKIMIVLLIIAIAVFGYLCYVLLHPEKL